MDHRDGEPRSEGHGDACYDLADGGLRFIARRGEPVGLRGQAHAVREDMDGEIVDVVGDAVVPPAKKSPCPCCRPEGQGAARRGSEGEHRRRPGGENERVKVRAERRVEGDPLDLALQGHELGRVEHGGDIAGRIGLTAQEKPNLDERRRVADAYP